MCGAGDDHLACTSCDGKGAPPTRFYVKLYHVYVESSTLSPSGTHPILHLFHLFSSFPPLCKGPQDTGRRFPLGDENSPVENSNIFSTPSVRVSVTLVSTHAHLHPRACHVARSPTCQIIRRRQTHHIPFDSFNCLCS